MPPSTPSLQNSPSRPLAPPPDLRIVEWPLKDQPLTSSFALALAAGASWLAVWATNHPIPGIIVASALALTLWRTWLPVQFQIGPDGIIQSILGWRKRIPWTAIRRCDMRTDGILLLPDSHPAPAAPLRGLYLHWNNHREALLAHLDYYLPGHYRFIPAHRPPGPAPEGAGARE